MKPPIPACSGFAVLGSLLLIFLTASSPAFAGLRAGGSVVDITPPDEMFPVSSNGSMRDRKVDRTEERIHARTVMFADDDTTVSYTVVDSCVILREIMDDARAQASEATGIPAENFCISATHCHSGVSTAPVFQSPFEAEFAKFLAKKIAEGIVKAHESLQPAEAGWAFGHNDRQVFNRRWHIKEGEVFTNPFGQDTDRVKMNPGYNKGGGKVTEPAGPIDPDVPVLAFRAKEGGQPLALLSNYSLHYVGSPPLRSDGKSQLSGDYFARFADIMAEKVAPENPDFVAVMSNGTSGDINNIDFSGEKGFSRAPGEQMQIVARSVAHSALDAYETIKFTDDVPVEVVTRELQLGVRKPSTEEIERANLVLNSAERLADGQLAVIDAIYANESLEMAKYPDTVPVMLQSVRIGDLCVNALPCEVFVEVGLELKESSPFGSTFNIELANGYNGYLPTPQQHEWGGYETWRARSSYLEVNASETIVAAFKEMMAELKK